MKSFSLFKLFFSYLKEHYKGIILYTLLAGIFELVFSLYSLPLEAVLYAAALAAMAALIAFSLDFSHYYKRHITMLKLRDEIVLGLDALPSPINLTQADYTTLLKIMQAEKSRITSAGDKLRTEMMDYYTLWVHQIKTPIAAMNLLLQSEDSNLSAELREELFKIQQYVDMVLSYLRLDSDTSDLMIREYDLDHIIKQAIHKYAHLFVRKKIYLDYRPLHRKALTDEKWLLFVVEQLLSNALKYTHTGSVSIYMEEHAWNTLVIADTGIGIAPEDLPRVFEKGFTGYNGRQDKKSTGIGLYLCKRILSRLSHTIHLESEPEKGTRALIDLAHIPMEVE